jgi:hypothetical protein
MNLVEMEFTPNHTSQVQKEWPAIGYAAPIYYSWLSKEEKEELAVLSEDFCIIEHEGQTNRFVRAILSQRVKGCDARIDYGVWVSLGEKSFNDYIANFETENYETGYLGYLSNNISLYEMTINIKVKVYVSNRRGRPVLVPQESQMDIPFVRDYYEGITVEEAEQRINKVTRK